MSGERKTTLFHFTAGNAFQRHILKSRLLRFSVPNDKNVAHPDITDGTYDPEIVLNALLLVVPICHNEIQRHSF